MTDTVLLKKKIEESGLRLDYIYESLDISRASLHNKMSGKTEFTLKEVQRLCDILNITSLREKDKIFFSDM